MLIKNAIESKLQVLQPYFLEVINESHKHNVPEGSESHFKVIIVADVFQGKTLVARHRMVNTILADELRSIHALVLNTMTAEEWSGRGKVVKDSPPCLGGSSRKQG
jgi:BolA family transcriptional regulator, general stress-responsive regulator